MPDGRVVERRASRSRDLRLDTCTRVEANQPLDMADKEASPSSRVRQVESERIERERAVAARTIFAHARRAMEGNSRRDRGAKEEEVEPFWSV